MESLPYASLLNYSMAGVAGICLLEKFIPVMPSYVMFVLLGMTLVDTKADLSLIIAFSVTGSVLGGLIWYSVGRLIGAERCERFVARFGRYILLKLELYQRLMNAYRRNQFWVTAIGQIVPTARIYLALPAGVIRLPAVPFAVAMTLGTLAWNAPLISLGFVLQNSGFSPIAAGSIAVATLIGIEAVALLTVLRRRPET